MSSKGSLIGGLFEADTPRAPLDQRQLWLIIVGPLTLLCLAWALTESEQLQWAIDIAALLFWNYLLVRAGAREPSSKQRPELSTKVLAALLLVGLALLGLVTALEIAASDWSLYPGPGTIRFALLGVPIIIWTNRNVWRGRVEEQALDS